MRSEWTNYKIEDFADVKSGKRLPKGHSLVDVKTDYPYIRLVDVSEGLVQQSDMLYLQRETHEKISRYIVTTGDICLAIVGNTIGMVFRVDQVWDNANLTENAARLTNFKDNVSSEYVYYYLTSYLGQNEILSRKVGSAQGKLPMYNIKSLEVPLPPLSTQKKIAHILSTLDDKIELNRKMNETLEAMAQALFKSWFVDFDPVHAKAGCTSDEELEQAAATLGISKEVLELFPSAFVESEMGMIPEGWEVSTIGNEFTVTMGQSPAGKSYNETKNGMIFFQGRRDFGTYFPSERVYTTEPKRLAKEDDILLSVRAPVGDINIAMKACCIGRGLSALKHKSDSISYSYLVVKNRRVYFDGFNTEGTVFGSVNQNTLKSLNVLNDEEIIKKFNEVAEPMFQQIKNNSMEILSLQKTRDTLLPKLLSGELDVSEVEM